jgi:hypothetical protein
MGGKGLILFKFRSETDVTVFSFNAGVSRFFIIFRVVFLCHHLHLFSGRDDCFFFLCGQRGDRTLFVIILRGIILFVYNDHCMRKVNISNETEIKYRSISTDRTFLYIIIDGGRYPALEGLFVIFFS